MNRKTQNGFSLVEVIIASAIITFSLISIIQIGGQSIAFSRSSVNVYVASTLLEEGAESVRTIRDNNRNSIISLAYNTDYYATFSTSTNMWSLSTASSTIGGFKRTISFAEVNRNSTTYDIAPSGTAVSSTRLVTVTVSWLDGLGTTTKKISFYLSNIFS